MKRLIPLLSILLLLHTLTSTASTPALSSDASEFRFDVAVNDAPARAFFQGLVTGTTQNILIHPDLSGRISMTLKNVTLQETLQATRDLYGYDFKSTRSGYLILPATIQVKIYQLNYLDLQRHGVSNTRISSGQITQGNNSSYSDGGSASVGSTASEGESASSGLDMSSTSVVTRTDSDFWSNVETNLKSIVGDQADRSVVINRQSGLVVVRAMPNELSHVGDYLQQLSSIVSRQVILEAKIVEVELSDGFQAGINWASVINNGNSNYFVGQAAPAGGFNSDPFASTGNSVTVGPGNPVTNLVTSALGGAFTLAADFSDFNTFIELLGTQGQTHVLSSPRVSTLNNQKAIIKAGSDEFFVTKVTNNTVTGTATSSTRDVELTPFFSGVALDVTPQISDDGSVILHVHPTVSEVTDQIKTLTMSGTTDVLPLALSQIRESDNIVKARSGQLVVIGGLMRESRSDNKYRTPFLSDIPLLGKLFQSRRKQSSTVELVILLRPIVVNDNDWDKLSSDALSAVTPTNSAHNVNQ
ncbi:MAG: pilus (MSHA type) biogenesis protein MshL [Steroidobacteraceae bacterium]